MTTAAARRGLPRDPIEILLVEDSPADVDLTLESFADATVPHRVHAVTDGQDALDFLHQRGRYAGMPRPDLIFLDLNLPRKDGREVLAEIKADVQLRDVPVVVLTSSDSPRDVDCCYRLQANCYVTKPIGLVEFQRTMRAIQAFWFQTVVLPPARLHS